MKFLIGILFCFHLVNLNVCGQNGNYELGARSLGLSGATITISDSYSGFNNIGALAGHNGITACISSCVLYGIPELLEIGISLNGEFLKGKGSINVYRFGSGSLSEQKVGLGYSHRIRFISLGIKLSYIQFLLADYGSLWSLSLEFGGLVRLGKKFIFGGYMLHPFVREQESVQPGFLYTMFKTGFSYRPSENLMVNIEYKWTYSKKPVPVFGLEYLVRNKVALRTGFNVEALQSTMGIGFRPGKFRLDYAIMIHPVLGITNELSMSVNFSDQ